MDAKSKKMQHIHVHDVDVQLFQKLKIELTKNGQTMRFWVQKAIEEKLKKDSKSNEK